MVWTMVGIGVVLLVAIPVFILQNGQRVRVRFLMANGTIPLGVALVFAALLGALLVLVGGGHGCYSCGWWHGAIAAPTSCPDRDGSSPTAVASLPETRGLLRPR